MSTESPDNELLHQYAGHGDEAAFAEVVRRHLNLVYASAVRLLNGDATLAQDVTQSVFVDLARKAATLREHATVAGWLHTSVRYAAAKAVRAEKSRRIYEQEASAMNDQTTNADDSWMQLHPLIDEAVGQLPDPERDAVLLRFFEEKSHRDVGAALGLSEDAARMRVERALEKLRGYFVRHGVTTTAALLASTLGAQAASVPAMPGGFATAVVGNSLTGAAGAGLATAGSMSGSGGAGVMAGKVAWPIAMKAVAILAGTALVATTSVLVYTQLNPVALAHVAQPDPNDAKAEAEYKLGLTFLQSDHPNDAIPHFLNAVRLKPNYAAAHCSLGDVYSLNFNQLDQAIVEYEAAIHADPNYAQAFLGLGNLYLKTNRTAEAIPLFTAAVRIKPDYGEAHLGLGNALFLTNRPGDAVPPFETAIRLMPNNAGARNNFGLVLLQLNRFAEAARQFEETLRLDPNFPNASDNLAKARQLAQPPPSSPPTTPATPLQGSRPYSPP